MSLVYFLKKKFFWEEVFEKNLFFILIVDYSKRPRLDQIPAANLDADDPVDDDVSIYLFIQWNYSSRRSIKPIAF